MIKLYRPQVLNEIGGRDNNEDNVYPQKNAPSENDQLFLVCDGVGGSEKGEIASRIICQKFPKYFFENPFSMEDENYLKNGLRYVENELNKYLSEHNQCKGMASTLTLVYFFNDRAYVAWIGDSRVYHIRDGKILFRTKDHSIVEDLIEHEEITEEEARTHPQRNIITRAVKGADNPSRLDKRIIDEIEPGDYFFLCTDGILENITHQQIEEWFKIDADPEVIKDKIFKKAHKRTKDNFSMYLIKILSVENKNPKNKPRKNKKRWFSLIKKNLFNGL